MKLYYTDVSQDMTKILTEQAQAYAEAGKRIFYIAPNSLSFEKERKVLELLPHQASFRITVTRFAQMARYFVLNRGQNKQAMDDTGLSMIFFRVLSQFSDSDLRVYGRLRKDAAFIQQLVDLYKELKTANLTVLDLQHLEDEKAADLQKIFLAASDLLDHHQIENQSKLAQFASQVEAGHLDGELADTVLIIDGFTRFQPRKTICFPCWRKNARTLSLGPTPVRRPTRQTLSRVIFTRPRSSFCVPWPAPTPSSRFISKTGVRNQTLPTLVASGRDCMTLSP